MAKRNYLRVKLQGASDDLIIEVRQSESDRLRRLLQEFHRHVDSRGFALIEAVTGETFALNLARIQYARFLWDMAAGPADISVYDEPSRIQFDGCPAPIETFPEPEDLFGLFHDLQLGLDPVIEFVDEDGELMAIAPAQVVWASASTLILNEGRRACDEP